MAYKQAFLELSGRCNAKCSYCVTGIENCRHPAEMPAMKKKIMYYGKFQQILEHLFEIGGVTEDTVFIFYNWGEPLLNPELLKILRFMYDKKLKYALSTNGSIPFPSYGNLPPDFFVRMESIIFSFCGFSQRSYDRIHQLNFLSVKKNVAAMAELMRNFGAKNLVMHYHSYQFNQGTELLAARDFCEEIGITFMSSCAYINDFSRGISYLSKRMPYDEARMIGKELFLFYVDELAALRPPHYRCPQLDKLIVDEKGILLPCCDSQEELGDVLTMDLAKIKELKEKPRSCAECQKYCADYLWQHPYMMTPLPDEKYAWEKLFFCIQGKDTEVFLWGAGADCKYFVAKMGEHTSIISAIIDSSAGKQTQNWDNTGLDVIPPEKVKECGRHTIIIVTSTKCRDEILKQLKNMGLNNSSVYYLSDDRSSLEKYE